MATHADIKIEKKGFLIPAFLSASANNGTLLASI
jgi:hypothetical protein